MTSTISLKLRLTSDIVRQAYRQLISRNNRSTHCTCNICFYRVYMAGRPWHINAFEIIWREILIDQGLYVVTRCAAPTSLTAKSNMRKGSGIWGRPHWLILCISLNEFFTNFILAGLSSTGKNHLSSYVNATCCGPKQRVQSLRSQHEARYNRR